MKRNKKNFGSVIGAILFFISISVVVSVAVIVLELVKERTANKTVIAVLMLIVIIILALVATAIDCVRRKMTVDKPVNEILTATDKIALLSDGLYRQFRAIIPILDGWYWTLTPWSCKEEYKAFVRGVDSSGASSNDNACGGNGGVRPLCYLNSEILVSIPEEDKEAERNTYDEAVSAARDDILNMLNAYPVEVWGDALGAAVASLFRAKLDAAEISEEEKAKAAEG